VTYCIGILVEDGLVMLADTRTNAGLDNVSTFRKLHLFERQGEKQMALATAGNLAFTQTVVAHLRDGFDRGEGVETLLDQSSMFAGAQFIGEVIRHVYKVDGPSLEQAGHSFDISMLFGGQFRGAEPHLYMLYRAGNFIRATTDTPYLQVGEHKYGKPILDRAIKHDTRIDSAIKLALISMDSTMRSNLGVGLPLDLVVLRKDGPTWEIDHRIDAADPYFHDLSERWSAALRTAHRNIPAPPYARS